VVEKLLAAGAVKDAGCDDGHTPLVYAEAHDQDAVAKMLRDYTGTSPIRNSPPP
jgi:ankyrin repeat protein